MIQNTEAMDRPVSRRLGTPRRLLAFAGLLVPVLGVALLYPTLSRWVRAERSVDLSRVRVGVVTRGDLERDISVQGRTVAAFHPTAFSPASGIVTLEVSAGDVVEQGQVLARLDSPELESRLQQERSMLQSLESDLERQRILSKRTNLSNRQQQDLAAVALDAAQRAMRRAERSRRDGILNDVEYETAQDDLRRSELELEHAREDATLERETLEFEVRNRELTVERHRLVVEELRRQVGDLEIRAPVAGLVSRIDVADRDAVEPNRPLVTIVDLSAFEIEILIPEAYADEVGPATPAVVHFAGSEYPGRVKSVSPEVEGSQVKGIVAFAESTPQGLRQNQRVSTRLILESKTDVLKVPRGPFLEAGGGRQVYQLDGGLAVQHPVEVGAISIAEVEILSGLAVGDRIVISDTTRFEDAKRVFLRD